MEQVLEVIVFYVSVKQFEQKSYQHALYKNLNMQEVRLETQIYVFKGLSDTKK